MQRGEYAGRVVETAIREACQRGDTVLALTHLLEAYGEELQRFLFASSATQTEAHDSFSLLVEDLWRGLPGFEWRCTARAWAYTLARHARIRHAIAERRRAVRETAATQLPWLRELVERTRTPTPLHQRSEVQQGFRKLREDLDERDQTLLMLRVDRGLSWKELATVLDEVRPDEDSTTAAARLRQRFQAIKKRLRDRAIGEGLLGTGDGS